MSKEVTMPRRTAPAAEIVDRVNYACYKHNRRRGVTSKDFCLIWSKMMVARMEKQYQEEIADGNH